MALKAQLGVVALPAVAAGKGLLVGVVGVQVVLQVIFTMERLLAVGTSVILLWRMRRSVPSKTGTLNHI